MILGICGRLAPTPGRTNEATKAVVAWPEFSGKNLRDLQASDLRQPGIASDAEYQGDELMEKRPGAGTNTSYPGPPKGDYSGTLHPAQPVQP